MFSPHTYYYYYYHQVLSIIRVTCGKLWTLDHGSVPDRGLFWLWGSFCVAFTYSRCVAMGCLLQLPPLSQKHAVGLLVTLNCSSIPVRWMGHHTDPQLWEQIDHIWSSCLVQGYYIYLISWRLNTGPHISLQPLLTTGLTSIMSVMRTWFCPNKSTVQTDLCPTNMFPLRLRTKHSQLSFNVLKTIAKPGCDPRLKLTAQ